MSVVIVDIFSDIVSSLRTTGVITGLSEASGVTTVTSVNSLSVNDVVTMGVVDYVILTASSTEFTVTGIGLTAESWVAKAPYYLHGHPIEMVNTLLSRNSNDTLKYQKYPLIYLVQDFSEKRANNGLYATLSRLRVIILTKSSEDYTSDQRYTEKLKPILYPLYENLIKAIEESVYFDSVILNHTKTDRLFWGTAQAMGNEANIFNDPIDAIEIEIDDLGVFEERFNKKC